MGRKFTAEEMKEAGVVARIFPKETFMQEVLKLATAAAKFPPQAMKDTKALIRDIDYDLLDKVSEREMTLLGVRMSSDESAQAIMEFMSKFGKISGCHCRDSCGGGGACSNTYLIPCISGQA
jgi:peroxisomal 3,2-trans-enoyl-CoA isomerase